MPTSPFPSGCMERLERLRQNISSVYMGNKSAVEKLLVCLLARGHVLIEDVPGVGKTVLAHALARSLDCQFARLQLTPDMLPADVIGVTVYSQESEQFTFKPGPIFSNILLADEINRTTPRTQSALLEAMNEAQVSVDGQTRRLPPPFMVIATQNPFEFEGTYFLPENQLDRFLMRLNLGYPSTEDEARIITQQPSLTALQRLEPVMTREDVIELQDRVNHVRIDESLVDYIIRIAAGTRTSDQLQIGVSPRGTLALAQAARATALVHQRDYVVPDDIISNVLPVCAHRVIAKTYMHDGSPLTTSRIIQQVIETIPSPA
ncbi:MAG: AAA domain-containing protein [Planctomycetes bacterium]|nr:AAA domain-containing protein [Planctomycetota bacterium]